NTLVHVSRPLAVAAFLEAISITTQARTAAIMEMNDLRHSPPVTGTGADCIIIAAPDGGTTVNCAGPHADFGEAVGAAVYQASLAGAKEWSAERAGTAAR
ncbi:MAG: adenosylcobinamide amidohydrolase, partial [Methylocystis sp.]|nr:adenosylcobinamide amidohydrolase [Methylocystis sp.]